MSAVKFSPVNVYIHWRETDEVREKMAVMYDKIVAAGLEKELEELMSQAYRCGMRDESDNNDENL